MTFHIVCHSHDDVGWTSPPDQYYSHKVKSILNTVTEALMKDPSRKFTQTEMYFFEKWWNEINDTKKEEVKLLIRTG